MVKVLLGDPIDGPMEVVETGKFLIDKSKESCKLKLNETTIAKTAWSKSKFLFEVFEIDGEAYIKCSPRFVDRLSTYGKEEGCGIRTILMRHCLRENIIHNVADNEENEAMREIQQAATVAENKELIKVDGEDKVPTWGNYGISPYL